MPTPTGLMDNRDVARLKEWHTAMAEADYCERLYEISEAVAGADLYERTLTDMNDNQCDYHTATVFNLPLAMTRRRPIWHRMMGLRWLRR